MKRAWFYHRTAGWEKRAWRLRLWQVDFPWIDLKDYLRIKLLWKADV